MHTQKHFNTLTPSVLVVVSYLLYHNLDICLYNSLYGPMSYTYVPLGCSMDLPSCIRLCHKAEGITFSLVYYRVTRSHNLKIY